MTLPLNREPPLDTVVNITATVASVPGEKTKDNNTATYPSVFAGLVAATSITHSGGPAAARAAVSDRRRAGTSSRSPRPALARLIALIWALVLSLRVRGGCGARRRSCSASTGRPTWSPTPSNCSGRSRRCTAASRSSPQHLDARMAAAEDRLDGAIAYRALVRYDAYNEMSGHQSTTIALLDADHNGVVLSSIAHRDTARLYCKQVHGGRGEHQLSPEEEEAVRLALAGEVGSVILESEVRAAYLGPPGTVSDEALTAAAPDARGRAAGVAARGRAVGPGRPVRARAGAGRERARGRRGPGARRAGARGARRRAGRRGRPAGLVLPGRRPRAAAVGDHDGALAPAGARPVHALAREHLPDAAPVPAASTADAVREVAGERDGTRAAIGPRLAARRYGAVMLAEDLEDDPGNATRFAWLARAADAPPPPDERPGEDDARVLGRRLELAGLARVVPGRVRVRRREPDPDRVAAAAPRDGRVHVLPRPRGIDGRSGRLRRRRQTSTSTPRWFESSAPSRHKNGPDRPLHSAFDGKRRTPRPTGVRAARRPPAART